MSYSIIDFQEQFPTNDVCLRYLFEKRFKNLKCPRCDRKGLQYFHRSKHNACFVCNCGKTQIYPKKGTIFEGSPTELTKWLLALYLMANMKDGITTRELSRQAGVTNKTAWRMMNRIRKLLAEKSELISFPEAHHLKKQVKTRHRSVTADNIHLYLSEIQYRSKFWKTGQNLFFLLLSMAVGESSRKRKLLTNAGSVKGH